MMLLSALQSQAAVSSSTNKALTMPFNTAASNVRLLHGSSSLKLRDPNPGSAGEQLVQGSPRAAIRLNAHMDCLAGFGIDLHGTATAPIDPSLEYMWPGRNLDGQVSTSLNRAALDPINLEDVGTNSIAIFPGRAGKANVGLRGHAFDGPTGLQHSCRDTWQRKVSGTLPIEKPGQH
jgi:hypothetical protein